MLLLRRIRGIIPMMKDKSVPFWKKAILVAGIVYLLLPVDLIPPLVPVFGWLDDIIIWIAILYFLRTELDSHIPGRKMPSDGEKYNYSGDDVHEVDFSVIEDNNIKEEENHE